jgi:hypothetical protein
VCASKTHAQRFDEMELEKHHLTVLARAKKDLCRLYRHNNDDFLICLSSKVEIVRILLANIIVGVFEQH